MKRTQLYLTAKQLRALKRRAFEKDISVAEAVRVIIDEELVRNKDMTKYSRVKNVGEWLLSLSREAENLKVKGPRDLASKVDRYLYGNK